MADFKHTWQAKGDRLGTQVRHVQVDVVLFRSATASFLDFLVHTARHEVAWCQVFHRGCITLHETFTVAVAQYGAFTTATLCQQHACAGHTGRVKLPEFHILQRNIGSCGHAQTIARVDVGIG
ncbi:MAG: hypothetical protein ACD_23C00033G0001 [uncultured bacterium]|nr:MAG: hypothetical protein ACD_23C00033G0001 [uncultured bacterium]